MSGLGLYGCIFNCVNTGLVSGSACLDFAQSSQDAEIQNSVQSSRLREDGTGFLVWSSSISLPAKHFGCAIDFTLRAWWHGLFNWKDWFGTLSLSWFPHHKQLMRFQSSVLSIRDQSLFITDMEWFCPWRGKNGLTGFLGFALTQY
jgi:hypothetical protein